MTGEMNAFLAELYGTGNDVASQAAPDDVEKLAQAEVLDQVLKQEGLTLDELTGDQILKVAENLFGADNEIVKMAMKMEGESDEEYEARMKKEKEGKGGEKKAEESMEEKVAEADFLGRVMAHSFWNEKGTIEKDAGKMSPGNLLARFGKKITPEKLEQAVGKAGKASSPGEYKKLVRKTRQAVGGAAAGTGAAAAAGGAYAAGKDKKASALDALAEERALAILKEAGVEPGAQPEAPAQPETPADGGDNEKLAAAIEDRAWELLKEHGYAE